MFKESSKEVELVTEDMINLITDDCFMDKDVSELVKGDYYVFLVFDDVMYIYKDGVVFGSCIKTSNIVYRADITSGTLNELSNKLECNK